MGAVNLGNGELLGMLDMMEDGVTADFRQILVDADRHWKPAITSRMYPDVYEGDFAGRTSEDQSLSIRTRNILKMLGMEFVGDLVRYYREHGIEEAERLLIARPSCGRRSVAEITLAYRKIEMACAFSNNDPDAEFIAWCLKHRDIIEPIRRLAGHD
jgi:hypothetical protein